MRAGVIIEKTYLTSQVANIVGIHPNTVRLYEQLGLISKPSRKPNDYRIFTDVHIDQFFVARTALQIEVLQSGLRKKIIEVVKLCATGQYDEAIALTQNYVEIVQSEINNANEAVEITKQLLRNTPFPNSPLLGRKEVSKLLCITMDTLRNWEMNGLLSVKRKLNRYRVYDHNDIQKLKIIRSLRCANYSLASILRMMNALTKNENADVAKLLNTPKKDEDIISVCDRLIVSLKAAKTNALKIQEMLHKMKLKY